MKWTLQMLRIHKKLKQTDVAIALGVSRKTIGAWESGKFLPALDKVDAICEFYGVSYDDIQWRV